MKPMLKLLERYGCRVCCGQPPRGKAGVPHCPLLLSERDWMPEDQARQKGCALLAWAQAEFTSAKSLPPEPWTLGPPEPYWTPERVLAEKQRLRNEAWLPAGEFLEMQRRMDGQYARELSTYALVPAWPAAACRRVPTQAMREGRGWFRAEYWVRAPWAGYRLGDVVLLGKRWLSKDSFDGEWYGYWTRPEEPLGRSHVAAWKRLLHMELAELQAWDALRALEQ